MEEVSSLEFQSLLNILFPGITFNGIHYFNCYFYAFVSDEELDYVFEHEGFNPYMLPFKTYDQKFYDSPETKKEGPFTIHELKPEYIWGFRIENIDLFPNSKDFVRIFKHIDYKKETQLFYVDDNCKNVYLMHGSEFEEFTEYYSNKYQHSICDFQGLDHIVLFKNLGILLLIREEGYISRIHFNENGFQILKLRKDSSHFTIF